jgi:hypothetical protein
MPQMSPYEVMREKEARQKRTNATSMNAKVGRNNKPPLRAKASVKNSHTSPKQIARRRKIDEALSFREAGHSYVKIARHMKVPVSTVHGWVVQGMNMIPIESAKAVLALELQRLDNLLSAHYADAVQGDVSATTMALHIIEKRCRLLGLFPESGRLSVLVALQAANEPLTQKIEFVIPGKKPEDVSPAPAPGPYPWQRQLLPPADVPMFRDPLTGTWRSGPTE